MSTLLGSVWLKKNWRSVAPLYAAPLIILGVWINYTPSRLKYKSKFSPYKKSCEEVVDQVLPLYQSFNHVAENIEKDEFARVVCNDFSEGKKHELCNSLIDIYHDLILETVRKGQNPSELIDRTEVIALTVAQKKNQDHHHH